MKERDKIVRSIGFYCPKGIPLTKNILQDATGEFKSLLDETYHSLLKRNRGHYNNLRSRCGRGVYKYYGYICYTRVYLYNRNLLAELLLVRKNFLFNLGMSKPNLGLDIPKLGLEKPKFGIDCFLNSFRFFR